MALFFRAQSHGTVKEVFGDMDPIDGNFAAAQELGFTDGNEKNHITWCQGKE